jgi:hypothetical protein
MIVVRNSLKLATRLVRPTLLRGSLKRPFFNTLKKNIEEKKKAAEKLMNAEGKFNGEENDEYTNFLELKEKLAEGKAKFIKEIGVIDNENFITTIQAYRNTNLIDKQFYDIILKEMMNRVTSFGDEEFVVLLKEICKMPYKITNPRFIERRLSEILKSGFSFIGDDLLDGVNVLCLSGQQTSREFLKEVIDYYNGLYSKLPEETKLTVLRNGLCLHGATIADIPKTWLAKLTNIDTMKEFAISVEIIKKLNDLNQSSMIPNAYKEKVAKFAKSKTASNVPQYLKLIEAVDITQSASIASVIKDFVLFLDNKFEELNFMPMIAGLESLVRLLDKYPGLTSSYTAELSKLNQSLLSYINSQKDMMSLEEFAKILTVHTRLAKDVGSFSTEDTNLIMGALQEANTLISEELSTEAIVSYLRTLTRIVGSPYGKKLAKIPEFTSSLTGIFNSFTIHRYSEQLYMQVLETSVLLSKQCLDLGILTKFEAGSLLQPVISKARNIQLTSFDNFVRIMSTIDESIELVGSADSRGLLLEKERILEKYKGQNRRTEAK